MAIDATGILDEAYERLHDTGPEFEGWLSNHGPMAAEAMARRGHAQDVPRWLDGYMNRLEEFPRGSAAIGPDWREALGDPRRIADWTGYFRREVASQPWRAVLGTWWPRLLPGVAAAATHGVIRTGHAVRALLADGDDPVHVTELAHGLAYWAARWQPVPGAETQPRPEPAEQVARLLVPAAGLAAMPRISATAPTAILRILPALSEDLWAPSAAAAWAATAALTAIYAPGTPAPREELPDAPSGPDAAAETFARAVGHGDEHVIKFADTAIDVHARTGSPAALAAAIRAVQLIPA